MTTPPPPGNPMPALDETLMRRFQRSGDVDCFEQLVNRFADRGRSVARQIVWDRSLADDAVQEAFLRVLRSRGRYDPARPFSTWFFTILRNVCMDMLRRLGREGQALNELAARAPRQTPSAPDQPANIHHLLAALPDIERDALTLRVTGELSLADVGAALGISEEAAKKRVQRGLRRLRERFAERSHVPGTDERFRSAP